MPDSSEPADGSPGPVYALKGSPTALKISLALFMAGFSTFSLLYCVQPLLPLFAQDFHISPPESALALSLCIGLPAVAVIAATPVAEGLERRSLMFISMTAAAALSIAQAFVHHWPALLMLRAIEGLALGGVPAVAMAYLAEEIDPRALGFSFGLYAAGNAIGGMAGRLGISLITDLFDWRVALASMGVIDLALALGFFLLLPRSRNFTPRRGAGAAYHWKAWTGHLARPALQRLFLIGFLSMGAFVSIYNYAGFRLMQPPYSLSQAQIGLMFSVYLFGVVSSSIAGGAADRFGHRPVLAIGLGSMALGIGLTLLAPLMAIILGVSVLTAGFFSIQPVLNSWVGGIAPSNKGHATSLYLLAYYTGASVIGSLSGHAYDAWGWTGLSLTVFTLIATALALGWSLRPGLTGKAAQ